VTRARGGGPVGIVLAGGRARRFGSDKLAADLGGRPVLWRTLTSLVPLVDGLVVVTSADAVMPDLPSDRHGARPVIVHDELPDAGPLAALLSGLRVVTAPTAIVLGGDMPGARPSILELLADHLAVPASGSADGGRTQPPGTGTTAGAPLASALLEGPSLRPLPLALRVRPALAAGEELIRTGERSLRALLAALGAVGVEEATWRRLDPDGASLRDVDTPADLAGLLRDGVAAGDS
jgi:molybdopterin-guanine dinucleotide biosynthesis protein A